MGPFARPRESLSDNALTPAAFESYGSLKKNLNGVTRPAAVPQLVLSPPKSICYDLFDESNCPEEVPVRHLVKLFKNHRSQVVRLPSAFRFDSDEVCIHRDPESGGRDARRCCFTRVPPVASIA